MKRVILLILMLGSGVAFAQKQQKPNLNKALKAYQEGKLNEAKDMIDAATTYEKTMNDGKTWYYRGLIYAALDTTSNESFKAIASEPLKTAMESFAKAEALGNEKTEYFVSDPVNLLPVAKPQQLEMLANYYLDKGIKLFQDEQDNDGSLKMLDKTKMIFEQEGGLEKYPNDTLTYYVAGLVASQNDDIQATVDNLDKYFERGGKSRDAYVLLYQMYSNGPHEDKEKALELVRRARAAVPNDPDFPKLEIGLLIDLNRIDEAKSGLEKAIQNEPENKILHFYLGFANSQTGNLDEARKNYQDAIKLDSEYYDAHYYLANTYLIPVEKTSKEHSATGNTPADSKKRSALIQRRVKESETALPYFEKLERMKAPDKDTEIDVLQKLSLLYYYVADDKNTARVDKKLKALGADE